MLNKDFAGNTQEWHFAGGDIESEFLWAGEDMVVVGCPLAYDIGENVLQGVFGEATPRGR